MVDTDHELTARQRQGVESRGRILDAAEALVARQGFASTSISQIAKLSGLPTSSLYWHFDSREGLLSAVVERGAQRWLREHPRWPSFSGDLGAFLDAVAKGADERPVFLRLLMMSALERHGEPGPTRQAAIDVWLRVLSGLRAVMADAFTLGDDAAGTAMADRLARFMLAAVDGAVVDAHIDPAGTDISGLLTDLHLALVAIATAPSTSRPR